MKRFSLRHGQAHAGASRNKVRIQPQISPFLLLACTVLISTFTACAEVQRKEHFPTPSAATPGAYKFLGAETSYGGSQGVCAEISVTDPNVPHDQTNSGFFYAWIMVYSANRSKWIQVGWSEVSWKSDAQYVTEYDTERNAWRFYDQYPLVVGHSYYFAISTLGSGSWAAWIWWNNRWNLLAQANIQLQSAERTGEFCELCTSTNNWFNVPITTFHSTCLLTGNRWMLWTAQQSTTLYDSNVPYTVHWYAQYSDWYMNESELV